LELTLERWIEFLSSVSDILALAGFSVLFVVEAGLATAWHRTLRLPMSATQSAPVRSTAAGALKIQYGSNAGAPAPAVRSGFAEAAACRGIGERANSPRPRRLRHEKSLARNFEPGILREFQFHE
jgi:hypothetical protein